MKACVIVQSYITRGSSTLIISRLGMTAGENIIQDDLNGLSSMTYTHKINFYLEAHHLRDVKSSVIGLQ